ncbi:MAG: hypothetical protein ACI4S3_06105 [Candidatus Gastranaerophilaceae bacterium]
MATLRDRFVNALLGTPVQGQGIAPSVSYGDNIDNYLNTLGEQSYMQSLLNQPKEIGLTLDQYKEGVAQGLNYGIPEIAKAQQQLGIRTPQTDEEKELARVGQFNQPTQLSVGTANDTRQGGLIPDVIGGFRENYTQGFDVGNLAPQNKGLATKIGEGLGTLARFYDKPIGRMAVATGLSALTGGVNPVNEGITAYIGRQNNLTQDKVYRNQLKQMGMSEEDVNSIPGIVNSDIFKSITSAMRYNNQRITWRQLAQISPDVAQMIVENPELADQFIPVNMARDIYSMKRETAKGKMEETKAKTEKTKAETQQVGKPKVTVNIKKGGTKSTIVHEGGSGGKPTQTTQTTSGGRPRIVTQYSQDEIQKELKRRGLI